jgi:type III restriction enzyme
MLKFWHTHYSIEDLNIGFIYTNSKNLSLHHTIANGYATIHNSTRKDCYESISLRSVHSKRFKEIERLSPRFIGHFLAAAEKTKLKENIIIDIDRITRDLISDGVIENPDQDIDHIDTGEIIDFEQNEEDIQNLLNSFVIENLHPFYPQKRSIGRVRTAFYVFFKKQFPDAFEHSGIKAQMVILASDNQQAFIDTLNEAKKTYQEEVGRRAREIEVNDSWEIKKSINYSESFDQKEILKCIVEPFYERNDASRPEKDFVDYLENNTNVQWWFKNGDRDKTFFAVPYEEDGDIIPFYVDWIVKYNNGTIGLYDTKGDLTAQVAQSKAKGFYKYIQEENEKGKRLFGGILYEKDGSFWLNNKEELRFEAGNPPGNDWSILPREPQSN